MEAIPAFLISTHTPLTGRDSTFPSWSSRKRISTHTPLTGRDEEKTKKPAAKKISTHTPLTGRDLTAMLGPTGASNFYSHAPHGT